MQTTRDKKGKKVTSHCSRVFNYFKEYSEVTGIHGLLYITENRTLIERLWWICCFFLSVICCGLMVYEIFYKYVNSPIMVTFSMKETHIQELPFPAVTICPRAKMSLSYFNVTEMRLRFDKGNISVEDERTLDLASTICEFYASNKTKQTDTTEEEFYKFLNNSRLPILRYCWYKQEESNCSELFTPILTEDGICYTFNILDKKDIFSDIVHYRFPEFHSRPPAIQWSVTELSYTGKTAYVYPHRVIQQGAKNALYITLKTKKTDVETSCSGEDSGYRVTLHLPSKIPDIQEDHIILPLDQKLNAAIIPRIVKTSKEVKKFAVSKRDCYFPTERKLKYFKTYNQNNCILECKANYTLTYCNCTAMHMPKTASTRTCLLQDIQCLEEVEYYLAMAQGILEVQINGEIDGSGITNCDCRPTCTDILYDLEISQNKFLLNPITKDEKQGFEPDVYYSVMNLYFKKSHAETKERTQVYGFTDVISNFGGLLGLFTGFSVLSFAEIIYFVSLRIWGNFRLFGTWYGKDQ